jgi:hypothetical protein
MVNITMLMVTGTASLIRVLSIGPWVKSMRELQRFVATFVLVIRLIKFDPAALGRLTAEGFVAGSSAQPCYIYWIYSNSIFCVERILNKSNSSQVRLAPNPNKCPGRVDQISFKSKGDVTCLFKLNVAKSSFLIYIEANFCLNMEVLS